MTNLELTQNWLLKNVIVMPKGGNALLWRRDLQIVWQNYRRGVGQKNSISLKDFITALNGIGLGVFDSESGKLTEKWAIEPLVTKKMLGLESLEAPQP